MRDGFIVAAYAEWAGDSEIALERYDKIVHLNAKKTSFDSGRFTSWKPQRNSAARAA